jgi:hypothetical protein
MRTDSPEKVLEKLATSDKATIVVERLTDRKMRVTSGSWDGEKVILRDQVLEVRNVDGRLRVARKGRRPDEWDPPIEPDDPYGPGKSVTGHDGRARRTGSGGAGRRVPRRVDAGRDRVRGAASTQAAHLGVTAPR